MQPGKRKRLHQIFCTHLRRVAGRLLLAGLCTLGVAAADLLKPWPLKIILDHAILDKPLPHLLRFLDGIVQGSKVTLVVEAACAIVLIACSAGCSPTRRSSSLRPSATKWFMRCAGSCSRICNASRFRSTTTRSQAT